MDLDSMEGLQAKSRPGGSIPPPPNSDAQATSIFEPKQLDELVGKATDQPVAAGPQRAPSTALVQSARSRFTPTLRSADFEASLEVRPKKWPVILGVIVFGAGLGAFVGLRPKPPAAVKDTALVELSIRADPPGAMFQIDGQALAGNPHRSEHKRGPQRRTLTIDAPGYAPQTIDLVLDSSTTVDVALQRTPQTPK